MDYGVLTRGFLKMGHFTRNHTTKWQSNIPIPLPCGILISTRRVEISIPQGKGSVFWLEIHVPKSPSTIGLNLENWQCLPSNNNTILTSDALDINDERHLNMPLPEMAKMAPRFLDVHCVERPTVLFLCWTVNPTCFIFGPSFVYYTVNTVNPTPLVIRQIFAGPLASRISRVPLCM